MQPITRQDFFSEQQNAMRHRLKLASMLGLALWIATPAPAQNYAKGADNDGNVLPVFHALEGKSQP
jgi:hypothetical protein